MGPRREMSLGRLPFLCICIYLLFCSLCSLFIVYIFDFVSFIEFVIEKSLYITFRLCLSRRSNAIVPLIQVNERELKVNFASPVSYSVENLSRHYYIDEKFNRIILNFNFMYIFADKTAIDIQVYTQKTYTERRGKIYFVQMTNFFLSN